MANTSKAKDKVENPEAHFAKPKEVVKDNVLWPAPGSEDTELGVLMEPEVRHGAAEVYAGVQA